MTQNGGNMSNQKNITPEQTPEKVMTKYDRKIQARREAELREKKQNAITRLVAGIIIIAAIVLAIGIPVGKRIYAGREYLRIGDHSFSKIEYDFFYGNTASNFLSSTGLSYSSLEDADSWVPYFNQLTVENIRKYVALSDDAKATNYSFDVDKAVDDYYKSMEEGATESGLSFKNYLKAVFGNYASKSNLKDCVKMYVTGQNYYLHLYEGNEPTEEEIADYYEKYKDDYDEIKYHVFEVNADVPEGASEEEEAQAVRNAKTLAETIAARANSGEDFTSLCAEYAPAEEKDYTAEDDASLKTSNGYSSVSSYYRSWLFDADRKEGDASSFQGADDHTYYVVGFDSRTYDEETKKEIISDDIASDAVGEYLSALMEKYEIVDKYNLRGIKETEDSDTSSDSGENADSAENNTAENE